MLGCEPFTVSYLFTCSYQVRALKCFFLFTLQQKLKEEREAKRQSMDGRHQFVINTMVSKVNMEPSEVEEFLLEGDQVRSLLATCRRRVRSWVRHPPTGTQPALSDLLATCYVIDTTQEVYWLCGCVWSFHCLFVYMCLHNCMGCIQVMIFIVIIV